jgi:2-hydroxychromene-2-carboxylate isomerase
MDIPLNPPPPETEPTPAGAASLYAEEQGKLRQFIIEAMHLEWGEGQNIAEDTALAEVANRIGLDSDAVIGAAHDSHYLDELAQNANEAEEGGVIGVPTFVIGEDIFWGQDRVDFVLEHLQEVAS